MNKTHYQATSPLKSIRTSWKCGFPMMGSNLKEVYPWILSIFATHTAPHDRAQNLTLYLGRSAMWKLGSSWRDWLFWATLYEVLAELYSLSRLTDFLLQETSISRASRCSWCFFITQDQKWWAASPVVLPGLLSASLGHVQAGVSVLLHLHPEKQPWA